MSFHIPIMVIKKSLFLVQNIYLDVLYLETQAVNASFESVPTAGQQSEEKTGCLDAKITHMHHLCIIRMLSLSCTVKIQFNKFQKN